MTSVEYSVRLKDHVRAILGDEARDLVTDEEIESAIELEALWGQRTDETLTCYNNKFRSTYPRPVHDVLIETPVADDHVYRIDESTKLVIYTSGGTAPNDRDIIKISYVEVRFEMIMAGLFEKLAGSHAKMASSQSVGGISIDTHGLTNEFRRLAQYWACKTQW